MSPAQTDDDLDGLLDELLSIHRCMLEQEECVDASTTHEILQSQRNLLHYLALRRQEVRPLQRRLERLGLSSLGRAEAHVLASVEAVISILARLTGRRLELVPAHGALSFDEGQARLSANAETIFGPEPKARATRILVTLPSEAADNYALVRELLAGGMDLARINCAHDDAPRWASMLENIDRARRELGRPCRVLMDIAGPKLRTGPIELGPRVLKLKPERSLDGTIIRPSWVHLLSKQDAAHSHTAANEHVAEERLGVPLVFPEPWLSRLKDGSRVRFTDLRGKKCELEVETARRPLRTAKLDRTAYIGPDTVFQLVGHDGHASHACADIPAVEQKISLHQGDLLILTRDLTPGQPASPTTGPARIACTLPQAFESSRENQRIWFDDGKIGGLIVSVIPDEIVVRINQVGNGGSKLAADKGINLPDTELSVPFLSDKDREDLKFVAQHADLIGLSFVQKPQDLDELARELAGIGVERKLAMVLKVETRKSFEGLPELLLNALERWPVSVMIARGDLAIEIGYERLAEIQEELLWISEAAHVPVIWATAVLETLAVMGTPSRAEITDAAMSQRAECVMLNKGPHVVGAIRMLDDILQRMEAHQRKKTAYLRPLQVSEWATRKAPARGETGS